jgi:hypothetical protein
MSEQPLTTPDGRWEWDGRHWLPRRQQAEPPPQPRTGEEPTEDALPASVFDPAWRGLANRRAAMLGAIAAGVMLLFVVVWIASAVSSGGRTAGTGTAMRSITPTPTSQPTAVATPPPTAEPTPPPPQTGTEDTIARAAPYPQQPGPSEKGPRYGEHAGDERLGNVMQSSWARDLSRWAAAWAQMRGRQHQGSDGRWNR